jgi:hypothetical protein
MNRSDKLNQLIKELNENKSIDASWKYIGTGNPNADILIIGKETSSSDEQQIKLEIDNNLNDWDKINDFNQSRVPNFFETNKYSPLYPYKGQLFKIDKNNNRGTSVTWYNYQKLINKICNNLNNPKVDFHEYVFITEVNSTPSKKTKDADISSIPFRKENILSSAFFQSFPIVIISGVGYFNINKDFNEIEHIFNVKFKEKKFADKEKSKQPFWLHEQINGTEQKLLINTYQLSSYISDKLLSKLSNQIKESCLSDF